MKRLLAAVWAGSLCAGTLAWAAPVHANPLKSLYTTLELAACNDGQQQARGHVRICAGIDGYPVRVADGEQRTFVSVGDEASKHRAARQSLASFNSIFDGKHARATLEWRIVRQDGRPVPFATILRYFTWTGARRGEVLVVSRVASGQSCHVAYVDALANPDAIAIARQVADTVARKFDCKSEPEIRGRRGTSPL